MARAPEVPGKRGKNKRNRLGLRFESIKEKWKAKKHFFTIRAYIPFCGVSLVLRDLADLPLFGVDNHGVCTIPPGLPII